MEEQLFHDHSTSRGQLEIGVSRVKRFVRSYWKIFGPLIAVGVVAIFFVVRDGVPLSAFKSAFAGYQNENKTNEIDHAKANHTHHHHKIHHVLKNHADSEPKSSSKSQHSLNFEGNDTFHSFDLSEIAIEENLSKNVSSITIRHLELNGPSFSESIKVFENLETITLHNVTVHQLLNMKKVNLPKLKYFSASLEIERRVDDKSDEKDKHHSHQHEHDHKEMLKSILFFEKEGKSWDFDKDLANLDVEIKVSIGGKKLLKISQKNREIVLNFPASEEILKNVGWTYSVLTFSDSTLSESTTAKIRENSLQYLNLNNVPLSDHQLSEIIKKQGSLTELLVNVPNGTISLDDLPKSLKYFSASGMKLKTKHGKKVELSSVQELVITDGELEETIVTNLTAFLPNLDTAAIFSGKHPQKAIRKLLSKLLKSKASRIFVGNFTTAESDEKMSFENGTLEVEGESEGYANELEEIGISKHSKNFVINLPAKGDGRVGMPLSAHEVRFFHFTLSEKNKILTFDEYLKIVADKK